MLDDDAVRIVVDTYASISYIYWVFLDSPVWSRREGRFDKDVRFGRGHCLGSVIGFGQSFTDTSDTGVRSG